MQNLKVKPFKINLESQKFAALEQPNLTITAAIFSDYQKLQIYCKRLEKISHAKQKSKFK